MQETFSVASQLFCGLVFSERALLSFLPPGDDDDLPGGLLQDAPGQNSARAPVRSGAEVLLLLLLQPKLLSERGMMETDGGHGAAGARESGGSAGGSGGGGGEEEEAIATSAFVCGQVQAY